MIYFSRRNGLLTFIHLSRYSTAHFFICNLFYLLTHQDYFIWFLFFFFFLVGFFLQEFQSETMEIVPLEMLPWLSSQRANARSKLATMSAMVGLSFPSKFTQCIAV